jgi:O-acetylserine/cysteine efflux transporter
MHLIGLGLLVSFIWGFIPIIDKFVLAHVDPKLFLLLFTGFMFLYALIYHRSFKIQTVDKKYILLTFLSSLLAFVALFVYLTLLRDNDSHLVSAIVYSAPMFTLLLAILILKEKPAPISIAGIILIIIGVWCIAFKSK